MLTRAATALVLTLWLGGCGQESGPITSRPQAVKRVGSVLKSAASAIRAVKDTASADAAAEQIAKAADSIDGIASEVRALPDPDEAEQRVLEQAKDAFASGTKAMSDAVDAVGARLKGDNAPRITSQAFALELMRLQLSVSEFALSLNPADAKALNRARDATEAAIRGRNGPVGPPTGPPAMPRPPELPAEARLSPEERLARFREQHGAEHIAIIRAADVPAERAGALATHIQALAGASAMMQSTRSGRTLIAVAPVADIVALHAAIDFGTPGPINGREFEVTVDLAKLPGGP